MLFFYQSLTGIATMALSSKALQLEKHRKDPLALLVSGLDD
jgi:hypothetical protein